MKNSQVTETRLASASDIGSRFAPSAGEADGRFIADLDSASGFAPSSPAAEEADGRFIAAFTLLGLARLCLWCLEAKAKAKPKPEQAFQLEQTNPSAPAPALNRRSKL